VKSVVMLLFVFGCVAVVYAVYWAGLAVSATKEASVILKESGSLAETVRRLYAHETTPDAYRMSSRQRAYVQTNFDEFVSIRRDNMQKLVDEMLAQLRAKKAAAGQPSEGELAEDNSARILVGANFEARILAPLIREPNITSHDSVLTASNYSGALRRGHCHRPRAPKM
jgi:hypothetical protein